MEKRVLKLGSVFASRLLGFAGGVVVIVLATGSVFAQVSYQQPSARIVRNADGTRLTVKVDPHTQQVEEVLADSEGAVMWRLVRELDEALQPLRATRYDGQNHVISQHKYLCLKGRIEEEEIFDASNTLLSKLVFYYDAKNRMTRVEQFNGKGALVSVSRSSSVGGESTSKQRSLNANAPSSR